MFPGIADRMGKEITALAPSSMKIKGAHLLRCIAPKVFTHLWAAACCVASAHAPMHPCPCSFAAVVAVLVAVCTRSVRLPPPPLVPYRPYPLPPPSPPLFSGGSPREEIQRVDRRLHPVLPLHLPAGAFEVEGGCGWEGGRAGGGGGCSSLCPSLTPPVWLLITLQMWISKSEYDESGPSIVHRKCF